MTANGATLLVTFSKFIIMLIMLVFFHYPLGHLFIITFGDHRPIGALLYYYPSGTIDELGHLIPLQGPLVK